VVTAKTLPRPARRRRYASTSELTILLRSPDELLELAEFVTDLEVGDE
jgi:hypothetical protein